MKFILYLFLAMIFLFTEVACDDENMYVDSLNSPTVDSIHMRVLNDEFLLADPHNIYVEDSLLIVTDSHCGEGLFHVFDKATGHHLKSGGTKGEGPGELLHPFETHMNSRGEISYWDMYKYKIVRYDLRRLLSDIDDYYMETPVERSGDYSILDALQLANGSVLYNGNNERHIGLLNAGFCLDCPMVPGIDDVEERWSLMNKAHWAVSPDEKHFVRATAIGGILRGYEISKDTIVECFSKFYFEPVYGLAQGADPAWVTWVEETRLGFDNVFVTNQCIYALLNGRQAKEEPFAYEILVIDWQGNILRKMVLDCTVNSIAVDEEAKKLYAIRCGFDSNPYVLIADI